MLTCKKYNSDYILITDDNTNNKDFLNSIGDYAKNLDGWLVSKDRYKKIKNLISEINNREFFENIKRIKRQKGYYRSKSPGDEYFESSESESDSDNISVESNFNMKKYLNNSDEETTSESEYEEDESSSDDSDFPEPISPRNRKSEIKQIKSNHRRRQRFLKELDD